MTGVNPTVGFFRIFWNDFSHYLQEAEKNNIPLQIVQKKRVIDTSTPPQKEKVAFSENIKKTS